MCGQCTTSKIAGAYVKSRGKGKNKTVELKVVDTLKAAGEIAVGYAASNKVTAYIEKTYNEQVEGSEPFNKNISGLVKLGLGGATIWASSMYGGKYAADGINLGLGMGASGGLDILSENLPDSAKEWIGISGATSVRYYKNRNTKRIIEQRSNMLDTRDANADAIIEKRWSEAA